jgi:hypothetical protein
MTIKADAVSRRIQRMYLHGLDCVRLIQSYLRVQFQKKVRAKVKRLLHEREQHALVELQKVTELKTLLEQCHSPEPSAAYWRKYGKAENPGDVKPMNLNWASMQSIVRKTAVPAVAFDQQRLKMEVVEQGHDTIEKQAIDQTETLIDNITMTRDISDPEVVNATQVHRVLSCRNHLGNSPFFKRIEEANVRAAELRNHGYEDILKLQRSARGIQSKHLVHEMKLGSPSPERLKSASEILSLPEIRATFRQLRSEEFPELLVHWAPPVKAMCAPMLSRNSSDQKRVPNPPSILTRNAQAFMSLRSKRLSQQKHDSS